MKHLFIGSITAAAVLSATIAVAQTAREVRGPAPVVPLADQPPARIIVDPPLAGLLSLGRVVIQYRTENLQIAPVFGPNAVDMSPRLGHIHVFVDNASWRWLDASGEPVTINGLASGAHKVRIQLVDANHQPLDQTVIDFVIPEGPPPGQQSGEGASEHGPPA